MARKPTVQLPPLEIEAEAKIGTHVTLYRGSVIGKHSFIADYVSVREQVTIGEHTITEPLVKV